MSLSETMVSKESEGPQESQTERRKRLETGAGEEIATVRFPTSDLLVGETGSQTMMGG